MIEQVKFTYFTWRKAFQKQVKTIKDKGRNQGEALKVLKPEKNQQYLKSVEGIFPNEIKTNGIKNKNDKIKKWKKKKKKKTKRKDLKYETKNMFWWLHLYFSN